MLRIRSQLVASLALVLLSGAARADVLVVDEGGSGDFTALADAVAAAQDGDVILVRQHSNLWPIPTVTLSDKALTIVGDGGQPDVDRLIVEGLAFGKTVVLRGLNIDAGLSLTDNLGSVRVEDCLVQGPGGSPGGPTYPSWNGYPAVLASNCHDVALAGCTLSGGPGANVFEDDTEWNPTAGGAGLDVQGSRVTVLHSSMTGGQGGSDYDDGDSGKDGGDGVRNVGGTLVLVGGSLVGANGGHGGCNLFPSFCGSGGNGGNGLRNVSASAVSYLRDLSSLAGGTGGFGAGDLPDGSDGRKVEVEGGSVLGWHLAANTFTVSSPVREAQPITLAVSGQPGDAAWVLVSLSALQSIKPPYQGALLVGAPLVVQLPLGVLSASGSLQLTTPAPELLPGQESLDVFLQGVVNSTGTWTLAPASTLTLVDASF